MGLCHSSNIYYNIIVAIRKTSDAIDNVDFCKNYLNNC